MFVYGAEPLPEFTKLKTEMVYTRFTMKKGTQGERGVPILTKHVPRQRHLRPDRSHKIIAQRVSEHCPRLRIPFAAMT